VRVRIAGQVYPGRRQIVLRDGSVLSGADSLLVGDALSEFNTQPAFGCVLPWEVGTLAVWDNQCCMHAVVPYDYERQRRKMWRLAVGEEEVPLPGPLVAAAAAAAASSTKSRARL
jgi:hypothetical protein